MLRLVPFADIWMPLTTEAVAATRDDLVGPYMGILLARDASDFGDIKSEFAARIASADLSRFEGFDRLRATPSTLFEFTSSQIFGDAPDEGRAGKLFTLLVILALLFMALPAINLVNINMSRILERSSEIGVRKAFGASISTLVAQFIVENVAITLAGGVVALGLALVFLRVLESSGLFPYTSFEISFRVFAYGLAAALVFGLLSGAAPAWRMARVDAVRALKGGAV